MTRLTKWAFLISISLLSQVVQSYRVNYAEEVVLGTLNLTIMTGGASESRIKKLDVFTRSGRRAVPSSNLTNKFLEDGVPYENNCPPVEGIDFESYKSHTFTFHGLTMHDNATKPRIMPSGFHQIDFVETVVIQGVADCPGVRNEEQDHLPQLFMERENHFTGFGDSPRPSKYEFHSYIENHEDTREYIFYDTKYFFEWWISQGYSYDDFAVTGWASVTNFQLYYDVDGGLEHQFGHHYPTNFFSLPRRTEDESGQVINDCSMQGFELNPHKKNQDDPFASDVFYFHSHNYQKRGLVSKVVFFTKDKDCYGDDKDKYSPRFYFRGAMIAQVEANGNPDNAYGGHFEDQGVMQLSPALKYAFDFEYITIYNNFEDTPIELMEVVLLSENDNIATKASLLWPDQSGLQKPKEYAIDGKYTPGECGGIDATCSKSARNLEYNYWNATVVSHEDHRIKSVKVYYPKRHGYTKPDSINWRGHDVILSPVNERVQYNANENSFVVSLKELECSEPHPYFVTNAYYSKNPRKDVYECTVKQPVRSGCYYGSLEWLYENHAMDIVGESEYGSKPFHSLDCALTLLDVATTRGTLSRMLPHLFEVEQRLARKLRSGDFEYTAYKSGFEVIYRFLKSALHRFTSPRLPYGDAHKLPLYPLERLLPTPQTAPDNRWVFPEASPWLQLVERMQRLEESDGDTPQCETFKTATLSTTMEELKPLQQDLNDVSLAIAQFRPQMENGNFAATSIGAEETFVLLKGEVVRLSLQATGGSGLSIMDTISGATSFALNLINRIVGHLLKDIMNVLESLNVDDLKHFMLPLGVRTISSMDNQVAEKRRQLKRIAESIGDHLTPFLKEMLSNNMGAELTDSDLGMLEAIEVSSEEEVKFDTDAINNSLRRFKSSISNISQGVLRTVSRLATTLVGATTDSMKIGESQDHVDYSHPSDIERQFSPLAWNVLLESTRTLLEDLNICESQETRRRLYHSGRAGMEPSALRNRAELLSEQSTTLKRTLQSNSNVKPSDVKQQYSIIRPKCKEFTTDFEKVAAIGVSVQSDLETVTDLLTKYESVSNAIEVHRALANVVNSRLDCLRVGIDGFYGDDVYLPFFNMLSVLETSKLRVQLVHICESMKYTFNDDTNALCSIVKILKLATRAEILAEYNSLRQLFERKWREATVPGDSEFESLDITELVDMDKVRGMNGTSDSFSFSISPGVLEKIPNQNLECRYGLSIHEATVVFVGTRENNLKVSTTVHVNGPFYQVREDAAISAYFPATTSRLDFSYEYYEEKDCPSGSELGVVCGKTLCDGGGGTNLGFKITGNYALPSLFATYQVQATTGTPFGFSDVHKVFLVYKGQWNTLPDQKCESQTKKCEWQVSTSVSMTSIAIGLGSVSGLFAVGAAAWFLRKWKSAKVISFRTAHIDTEDKVSDEQVQSSIQLDEQTRYRIPSF